MALTDRMLAALARHIGASQAVGVDVLAAEMGCAERAVRGCVSALRWEGYAVCAHPTEGYYLAATAEELDRTCAFLRARAMHSLAIESRLRKIPLPDLIGQLKLET